MFVACVVSIRGFALFWRCWLGNSSGIAACELWDWKITTPTPHHSIFTGQMPFLTRNQRCQITEGKYSEKRNILRRWSKNRSAVRRVACVCFGSELNIDRLATAIARWPPYVTCCICVPYKCLLDLFYVWFFSIQEIGREERRRNDVFVLSGDETLLKLKLNASEL